MLCSVTEIAKIYGVSKAAVTGWGLVGKLVGAKKIIDTEDERNKEILKNKTKRVSDEKPEAENKPETAAQNQEVGETPQTESKDSQKLEMLELQKRILLAREKDLLLNHKKKELEIKEMEYKTKEYIHSEVVGKMLSETTLAFKTVKSRVLNTFMDNNNNFAEETHKIFAEEIEKIVLKWKNMND
jgi:hypothetical protein